MPAGTSNELTSQVMVVMLGDCGVILNWRHSSGCPCTGQCLTPSPMQDNLLLVFKQLRGGQVETQKGRQQLEQTGRWKMLKPSMG